MNAHRSRRTLASKLVASTVALLALSFVNARTGFGAGEDILQESLQEAFEHSDANNDRYIDRREYYSRLVDVFFFADRDHNSTLEVGEYDATALGTFKQADADKDGSVTLVEFMNLGFEFFAKSDEDGDGRLSWDEVEATFE